MPIFEYSALDSTGKTKKGSLDAETLRAARQRLRTLQLTPVEVHEGKSSLPTKSAPFSIQFTSDRVGLKPLSAATRQLATLVGAGIPLVECLSAVADQVELPALKRTLVTVREQVEAGSSLSKSLHQFPKVFPRLYVNMVASGEASGTLDTVLNNLADYFEASLELRRKVTSALFYPILMLSFSMLVVLALLTFVVPTIVEIFQKQNAALPVPTQILIFISHGISQYWAVILAIVIATVYGLKRYHGTPEGRAKYDMMLLKAPLIGGIYTKIATARVAGTLGTLLAGGVNLLAALDIVRNIVGNVHMQKALDEAREGVREGKSLARELQRSKLFPSMPCQMIAVGERSGTLDMMVEKAGTSYEREVDATISGLTSLLEPLLIMMLGGVVLAIVLSILLPMVNLMDVVQS